MILVMGLVGFLASALLVATFVVTEPYIEANLAEYLEQAINEVLPEAVTRDTYVIDNDSLRKEDGSAGRRVFATYNADSLLSGIVIEAQGQGYADVIRIIYAYSFDCACIVGMKVLESRETPGLGDKIEKDPMFIENFSQLDVRWSPERRELEGALELVTRQIKSEAWQIDGIAGATISSRAITDILNRSNDIVIPLLYEQAHLFEEERR